MKLKKKAVAKVLAGVAMIVLAALAAVVIKDTLAMRQPENALPIMTVYYNGIDGGTPLRDIHVQRDAYTWRFLFTLVNGGGVDLTIWQGIPPAYVNPGALLEVGFTFPPSAVQISLMHGEGVFVPLEAPVYSPDCSGRYTYRVEAQWSGQRRVVYYFNVEVPDWTVY